LQGRVLDVGGGAGIAARFLPPEIAYVVVDPSEIWSTPEWIDFGKAFRAGGPEPEFIGGVAEDLPFADASFDAVLSFWSLNHVSDPRLSIGEMTRVLRPGGALRVVVDDVAPSWLDFARDGSRRIHARLTRSFYPAMIQKPLLSALAMKVRGQWEIQPDHLPIAEKAVLAWTRPSASLHARAWFDGSLTLDFVKG
jgi:ubiquinone/menaquinone biosynthesis C-methylase UbiE